MANLDTPYLKLLSHVLRKGKDKPDRTGTGCRSSFGHQMRFDISEHFPLLTSKRVNFKAVAHELLWFLSGSTNSRDLEEDGVNIWTPWADGAGNLGRIYGAQWRNWMSFSQGLAGHTDQIKSVRHSLEHDPNSRRHVITAWNPGELGEMNLPPCHILFQFYVVNNTLSCHLYQRSADMFLGVPFNIASYALLTYLMATDLGYAPGEFIHSIGDAHIYHNHFGQVQEQLRRPLKRRQPKLIVHEKKHILDYRYEDFTVIDYDPHPAIPGEVSV